MHCNYSECATKTYNIPMLVRNVGLVYDDGLIDNFKLILLFGIPYDSLRLRITYVLHR